MSIKMIKNFKFIRVLTTWLLRLNTFPNLGVPQKIWSSYLVLMKAFQIPPTLLNALRMLCMVWDISTGLYPPSRSVLSLCWFMLITRSFLNTVGK